MTKKCGARLCIPGLARHFFRHSAVLSLTAVLLRKVPKGRFTRYDFVACDKFMTGLRHEMFRVNQTYNSPTTVVYVKKIVV